LYQEQLRFLQEQQLAAVLRAGASKQQPLLVFFLMML
jgi:hypothetical protein